MKYSRRYRVGAAVVFAVLLPLRTGALNARNADPAPLTLLAAHSAKYRCINTCRARYRDCMSKRQIPSFECRGVYQDCARFTCNVVPG